MKKLFDLTCALIGLIILLPVFAVIAVWIKQDSRGPIFFRQERVGRHGKHFRIFKFRTMYLDAEIKGRQITVSDDPRITRSGRFLRRYKLDELPQLINVLTGEMSLVGPRPEVPRYVEIFKDDYDIVLQVKPGITDYAAIEFKNENEVLKGYGDPEEGYIKNILPKKIELYKRYLSERSFRTDLKLIFRTLSKLV